MTNTLHILISLIVACLVATAVLAGIGRYRARKSKERRDLAERCNRCGRYVCTCGAAFRYSAWIALGAAVALCVVMCAGAVNRTVNKASCEKRRDLTGQDYIWLDLNFFDYSCVLRTPSGNVTPNHVVPFEEVEL